ncbi:MAG: carboxypeptidase regulatory-like domain-containing protein [Planctomycetes bacterium]|nr:carboxypeptidase regulatory-like domain-containing protein [Planctomycetota bacterium]
MGQAKGSSRLWIGGALACGVAILGAFVALGPSGESAAGSGELASEEELVARERWLAAQGQSQSSFHSGAREGQSSRTLRTAEQAAGIVVAPDGAPVPGATLVLSTRPQPPTSVGGLTDEEHAFLSSPGVNPVQSLATSARLELALNDVVLESSKLSEMRRRPGGSGDGVAAPQWAILRTWKADAEGRFTLDDLPAGELLLDAHDGRCTLAEPLARHEIEGAPHGGLRLALVAGHRVEGHVRDGAGLPLTGVAVSGRSIAWEDGRLDPVEQRSAVSDASGAYRLAGLRAGARYQLGFALEHFFSAAEPELLEVRRDETLDHVLTAHAIVAGTVSEGGAPKAGVDLELRGFGVEKSDASGRFRFRPRLDEKRTLELFARSADQHLLGTLAVEVDVAARHEDLKIALERACVVRGRVVDETGRGVGGASVELRWEDRRRASEANAEAALAHALELQMVEQALASSGASNLGAERREALEQLAHARASLAVAERRARESISFSRSITLSVGPDGLPTGSLSRSADGLPTRVVFEDLEDFIVGDAGTSAGGIFEEQRSVAADAEGRYEFLGVWPGRYRVSAAHPEHLAGEDRECALAPGDEREVDLILPRGAKVAGTVFDLEGRPAENVAVIAVRGGDEQQRAQTDASGRFAMVGFSPGELDLVANAEDGGNAALRGLFLANGSELVDLSLRLGAGAGLFGRVVDGRGAPIPGASILLHSTLASSAHVSAESAADGSYRVERALRGEHRLFVQANGYLPFEMEGLMLDGLLRRDITLERGATLHGTIYGPDGEPLAGALIFLFHGDEEDQSSADEAGRFRFLGLHPGSLQVYVRAEDYSSSVRASRELSLGEDVVGFDLRLVPSGVLRGIVRDAAGKPVAGIEVNGETEPGGQGRREATTASDGRFELRALYPDHYRVYAGGDSKKGVVVDARAGGELAEIELVYAR